jgi:hypothetical protein
MNVLVLLFLTTIHFTWAQSTTDAYRQACKVFTALLPNLDCSKITACSVANLACDADSNLIAV